MITLGIPGDAVTAVIIGALYIHGLKPGPMLMLDTPHLFWFSVGCMIVANVFLLIFGLMGIKVFAKMVELRKALLLPIIIVISIVGSYAIQNSIYDVYWMIGFGIVGYFLKLYGFQVGPVILGVILGPLMETGYRQSMQDQQNSILGFLTQFFVNPLTLVLTLSIAFMLIGQTQFWAKLRGKLSRENS